MEPAHRTPTLAWRCEGIVGGGVRQGRFLACGTSSLTCASNVHSAMYYFQWMRDFVGQVMRESLAKLEALCLGNTGKDQDWTGVVEDTRCAQVVTTPVIIFQD